MTNPVSSILMESKDCKNPIRVARLRLHLTQKQLGEILGVVGRTVSGWETGTKHPSKGMGPKLKAALGLSDIDVWRGLHYRSGRKIADVKRRTRLW